VGGNTQEKSTILVDGLSDGSSIDKMYNDGDTVTTTPIINYSLELLYTMGNISALTDTAWFFGLSFNESAVQSQSPNVPLAAHWAQTILGDYLLGTAMGNEPDLWVAYVVCWNLGDCCENCEVEACRLASLSQQWRANGS
jgi:hypothetical protein